MMHKKRFLFSDSVKRITAFLAVCLLILAVSGCAGDRSDTDSAARETNTASEHESNAVKEPYQPDPVHGSAVTMEGKTLLLSVFTSDKDTSWDYDSAADKELIADTLKKLRIATDFLSEQAARFDKKLTFVYDWTKSDDLMFKADFDETLVQYDSSNYTLQVQWLKDHINLSALMQKYGADDAVFIFYFNTDADNPVNSWELSDYDGTQLDLEFCNFYLKFDGADMPAASFAHEIMHTYGAKDLYTPSNEIPQAFVNYLEEIGSQDIMYAVFSDRDEIFSNFTDLDAYYVGIAPRPEIADEWNLAPSEHDTASSKPEGE